MLENRKQLGDFLRSRRERLKPDQLGLPRTPRRRTPGLRREEVASVAGISVEWYVSLEQGRAVTPSPATIDSLARALLLDATDQAHLSRLARTGPRPPFVRENVPATLGRLVESLDHPAYITGRRWDVLAWNVAAADLLTDFDRLAIADRNILLYVLTDPRARLLFGKHWADEARRMVALFRATHDLWTGDPAFDELVARVGAGCREFEAWWTAYDIGSAVSGTKTLQHPTRGVLRFAYATFQANDDPRLKLAVYLPA